VAQAYNPSAAIECARSYVGCKWRHRGRSRFGIDCIGLVIKALQAGGIAFKDRLDYGRDARENGLERELREHFGEPVNDALQAGDIVLMHFEEQTAPNHVGIIGIHNERLTLIHSSGELLVCEHGLEGEWLSRIVARFRLNCRIVLLH